AAEFNLSETAFARKLKGEQAGTEEEPVYELRWRTPTVEVNLCGHATLATAHVLFSEHHPAAKAIRFASLFSGELRAVRDASTGQIALDFPAADLLELVEGHRRRPKIVEGVVAATKLDESKVKRVAWYDGFEAAVVEIGADVDLAGLKVDIATIKPVGKLVILTQPAPADSGYYVYSRVFAPAVGIDEDPVTGAAHTAIAPFWFSGSSTSRLLTPADNVASGALKCKQVSQRGGEIDVVLSKDRKRVELKGRAKTVMKGEVFLE
ncbi:hypothetical protein JCM8547_000185, partial [Rhodosporidiobolus lusitaniae]